MATITNKFRQAYIDPSCGCSMTRTIKFVGPSPEKIESWGRDKNGAGKALFQNIVEAPMIGVAPKGLMELLVGGIKQIGGKLTEVPVRGTDIMAPLPYTYRQRESYIANEYFQIVDNSGAPNANAGTTVGGIFYPESSWNIVVRSKPAGGHIDAADGTPIASYFVKGNSLFVERHDAGVTSKPRVLTMHKIINSVDNGNGTATVTIAANRTENEWDELSGAEKAVYQPEFGVVYQGTNNIGGYENYCETFPTPNSTTLLVDYHQSSRYVQCYNKEYLEALDSILNGDVNAYQENFKVRKVVDQNRIQFQQFQRAWFRSIFYGQKLGSAQSPELYLSTDIDDEYLEFSPQDDCPYRFKANALGIYTILNGEGQVIDLGGGYLDLDQIFELGYIVKRNRELNSNQTVDRIDLVTDKQTADLIARTLIPYLKDAYGQEFTRNWQEGKVADEYGAISFTYNIYSIPSQSLELAVFVDNYFTDRIEYFSAGGAYNQKAHSGQLWVVDFSDINIGIVSNRSDKVNFKDPDFRKYNEAWKCVMDLNTEYRDFRETRWTTMIGNPKKHFIVTNYNPTVCPKVTQITCAPVES